MKTPIPPYLLADTTVVNGEKLADLRSMIYSPQPYADSLREKDRLPGTYVALDCEMVGVGPAGSESTLARVSIVNFCGAVLLDAFVRQKERVTDWRTQWSGVRERDMVHAKSFEEVQTFVADLIKDRVLIGHAIHNDMKVLMLSHPRAQLRDTQHLSHKNGQTRSSRPALRNLVREMLGISIQEGEHSSVIDARATMAIYRLHRKQWERAYSVIPVRVSKTGKELPTERETELEDVEVTGTSKKRKRGLTKGDSDVLDLDDSDANHRNRVPVHKKGISSGLSTIVTHRSNSKGGGTKSAGRTVQWWKELGRG
ncbi:ribonuclease H-like protein [Auriscalpium vulgare]|uniref:Ribonuclease H-like protein n=1 Tax=Auriscalpium vulgare TaxID=40419 RepID=A0ACB8RKD2_9AGAM|nr:ribonuclease H-like protein [Auriscalpium vulgare]